MKDRFEKYVFCPDDVREFTLEELGIDIDPSESPRVTYVITEKTDDTVTILKPFSEEDGR